MSERSILVGSAPPPPHSDFVGRSNDLAELRRLLSKQVASVEPSVVSLDRRRIKEARAGKKFNQQELAERAGCGLHTIINAENDRPIRLQIALEIAQALDKSLDELKALSGDSVAVQTLIVVRGLPGVGKTTLAAALAHDTELKKAFPDGVLWTSLGQEPALLMELSAWGRALGENDLHFENDVRKARWRLAALLRNRRMLLFIDDVWRAEHAMALAIGGPQCAIMVTTRIPEVANTLVSCYEDIYSLGVLTEEEGLKLLQVLVGPALAGYRDEARALVAELEGLPLALQVAGRLLRSETIHSNAIGIDKLLRNLRDATRLLPMRAPTDDLAPRTVRALLKLSTDVLDKRTRMCFAQLAPFAPKPAYFDLAATRAVWRVTKNEAADVINTLTLRGLLEPLNRELYWMHGILVAHAKSLLATHSSENTP